MEKQRSRLAFQTIMHKRHDIFHVRFICRNVEHKQVWNAPVRPVGVIFKYVLVLQKFPQITCFVEIVSLDWLVIAISFQSEIGIVDREERIG